MKRLSPEELVAFLAGPGLGALQRFVTRQRWFAAKARGIRAIGVEDWAVLDPDRPLLLLLLSVDSDRYYVPLSLSPEPGPGVGEPVASLGAETIIDAHSDATFGRRLLGAIASGRVLAGHAGHFRFRPMPPWTGPGDDEIESLAVRRLSGEQSNTSIVFDRALILKSLRRPGSGINPDLEIMHFLTSRTSFPHVPRLRGWIEYADRAGETAIVAVLQHFIDNLGDGWRYTLAALRRLCDWLDQSPAAPEEVAQQLTGSLAREMCELGVVTGGLHAALASDPSLPAFSPEPVAREDTRRWASSIAQSLEQLVSEIAAAACNGRADAAQAVLGTLTNGSARVGHVVADLDLLVAGGTYKIRCHGDYHLGQVLKTASSFAVIDFEGEPACPVEDRRAKHTPLRDIAGMLRSFNYAIHGVLVDRAARDHPRALAWLERWERLARDAFLDGYVAAASLSPVRLVPPSRDDLLRASAAFELEKACYELRYEANNRPDWIPIPLAGISRILETAR